MANKSRATANLVSNAGISTISTRVDITSGPLLIGTATSTGTADQDLQVVGNAYVSGSVGIGTTNPAASTNLDIRSTSVSVLLKGTAGSSNLTLDAAAPGIYSNQIYFSQNAIKKWALGGQYIGAAASTSFSLFNYDTYRNSFVVTNTDNIGIGTTNPLARLAVYGDGNRLEFVNSPVWIRPNTGGTIGTALALGCFEDNLSASAWDILTADTYPNTAEFLDASDLLEIRSNRYNAQVHFSNGSPTGIQTFISLRHLYGTTNNEIRIHDGGQPATRILLSSNNLSYFTNRVGIGSTIPKSSTALDVLGNTHVSGLTSTATLNVGTGGTVFRVNADGGVGIGTTDSSHGYGFYINNIASKRFNNITGFAEAYSNQPPNSSLYNGTYQPAGCMLEFTTSSFNNVNSAAFLNFNAYNASQHATGLYFGAVAGTTSNGPADFALGRRTNTQSWAETLKISHAGSATRQYLGFGTNVLATQVPITIAGSINQKPYGISHTYTGLTTAFDSSGLHKVTVLPTSTESSGTCGIVTQSGTYNGTDDHHYVSKKFTTMFTTQSTAFNQDLCRIDCSTASFHQIMIKITWATRIQNVSDGTTQANERLYGVNKFNTTTGAFSIGLYINNTNATSTTHMDIEVVDKGGGIVAVQYQQSASVQNASFIGGTIEIWAVGQIFNAQSKIVWNV